MGGGGRRVIIIDGAFFSSLLICCSDVTELGVTVFRLQGKKRVVNIRDASGGKKNSRCVRNDYDRCLALAIILDFERESLISESAISVADFWKSTHTFWHMVVLLVSVRNNQCSVPAI